MAKNPQVVKESGRDVFAVKLGDVVGGGLHVTPLTREKCIEEARKLKAVK